LFWNFGQQGCKSKNGGRLDGIPLGSLWDMGAAFGPGLGSLFLILLHSQANEVSRTAFYHILHKIEAVYNLS
jgi:hypothetical protein